MTTPREQGFAMPPEWARHDRCWMAWPWRQELWGERLGAAQLACAEIAGIIKWFDISKGYGFIVPDNGLPDVLLHVTCLRAGGYRMKDMIRYVVKSPIFLQK